MNNFEVPSTLLGRGGYESDTAPTCKIFNTKREHIIYYDPTICDRKSHFGEISDVEKFNRALGELEYIFSKTDLTTCEIRVLICTIAYTSLTYIDIQSLTHMKQSAVSKTISKLRKKNLVECKIGKKYEVGRPYQVVVLIPSLADIFKDVYSLILEHRRNLTFFKESLTREAWNDEP